MGTPHRGTGSITSNGLVYAAIASDPSLQVDDTVLKALMYGNDTLMDVSNEFVSLCNAPGAAISLCCFFEQRPTKVGRIIGNSNLQVFTSEPVSMKLSLTSYRNSSLMKFRAALTDTLSMVYHSTISVSISFQVQMMAIIRQ
jgi:hypothetical protein